MYGKPLTCTLRKISNVGIITIIILVGVVVVIGVGVERMKWVGRTLGLKRQRAGPEGCGVALSSDQYRQAWHFRAMSRVEELSEECVVFGLTGGPGA